MALFIIDEKKCKKDGICVAECPVGILEMKDPDAPPTPIRFAEKICIRCGHCVAVCPHGAFSLETMKTKDCPPLDRKLLPTAAQFAHLARARRSIRVYKKKPVPDKELASLINIARYAPTAKNTQQIGWLVVNGKEKMHQLAAMSVDWMRQMIEEKSPLTKVYGMSGVVRAWENGTDAVLRGAPALIVAHAPADYGGSLIDSTIALTTLELAAAASGLGCCWAGFFMIAAANWQPVKQMLALPEGRQPFGALMVGYPKFRYWRLPERNEATILWR
ncbi:MAG: nitroreductase family protein [Deltaproteobacteria bacterium]